MQLILLLRCRNDTYEKRCSQTFSKKNEQKNKQEKVETVVSLRESVRGVAKGGNPIILMFDVPSRINPQTKKEEKGWGHAVVADKYEEGSFDAEGHHIQSSSPKYNGRIRYYDSNKPDDTNRYIYINSVTGDWYIEAYKDWKANSSTPNADLGYIDDLFTINIKDMEVSVENKDAIALLTVEKEITSPKAKNTHIRFRDKTLSLDTIIDGRSDLSYWYDRNGESESFLNIALPDNKEDYSVSSPDAYDYSLKYPDAFLSVQSGGAESASFERGGTVKLAHNTGSYKLTSTLDSATGNLYTFGVTGTDGGNVELRKTEGAYVIKADSLKGATVEASGDDVTKSIALDGSVTEVQISSDGTDITASIDEDGDGIFEKAIASSAQGKDNQGKDDKQNKGDDGAQGPTDRGSKVSSTFDGNAGSARVSDVQPERGGGDLPKTGDSSPLFVALPLAVLGALATVLGIVLRRRREDSDSGGVDG